MGQAFNTNGDPVPVLSMDCLAANGYGQWTLSSIPGTGTYTSPLAEFDGSSGYQAGWYLLANGLYAPSSHYDATTRSAHPGCIPPGVVHNGLLNGVTTAPTEPKNAANLDGSVCYVWPDPVGASFQIELFTPADMDISLSFCSNQLLARNVVTSPRIVGTCCTRHKN